MGGSCFLGVQKKPVDVVVWRDNLAKYLRVNRELLFTAMGQRLVQLGKIVPEPLPNL